MDGYSTTSRERGRKGLRRTREDWRGAEDTEDEDDTSPGRTGEGQRISLRAVGRRGHFAREDWRGTEDAEDERTLRQGGLARDRGLP